MATATTSTSGLSNDQPTEALELDPVHAQIRQVERSEPRADVGLAGRQE